MGIELSLEMVEGGLLGFSCSYRQLMQVNAAVVGDGRELVLTASLQLQR